MLNKKTGLFGMSRQEVNAYLEQVVSAQQAERAALEKELAARGEELARLGLEQRQLEDERLRSIEERRLLGVASQRLDRAVQALQRSAAEEIAEQRERAKALTEQQQLRCRELDQQILGLQKQVDELLQRVVKVTGTSEQPAKEVPPAPAISVDYGGEAYWDQDLDLMLSGSARKRPAAVEIQAVRAEPPRNSRGTVSTPPPLQPIMETARDAKQSLPEPQLPPSSKASSPPVSPLQGSPGVSDEIRNIRYRYIVGKVAGCDLVDADGQMIIRQNETITRQIVEQAEQTGKLPELIINMQLPGVNS
jgi:FKBP-type peptidyl-prolyl cis-trans isomerase